MYNFNKNSKNLLIFSIVSYLPSVTLILLSIAFFTLMERKLLSYSQLRVGPSKTGMMGLLQPFSDAVKLVFKSMLIISKSKLFFSFGPSLSMGVLLMSWWLMSGYSYSSMTLSMMLYLLLTTASIYAIILMALFSYSLFSGMGGMRTILQMLSYEVPLITAILTFAWLMGGYSISFLMLESMPMMMASIIFIMTMVTSLFLAESNRTPYDFSEGESELVSGFNTEYSGLNFTLIFLSEYGLIMFSAIIMVKLFFSVMGVLNFVYLSLAFLLVFIWVRGTLPRYRYDLLINLAWLKFTPTMMLTLILTFSMF